MTQDEAQCLKEAADLLGVDSSDPTLILGQLRAEVDRLTDIVQSRLSNKVLIRTTTSKLERFKQLLGKLEVIALSQDRQSVSPVRPDYRSSQSFALEREVAGVAPEPRTSSPAPRPTPGTVESFGWVRVVSGVSPTPAKLRLEQGKSVSIFGSYGEFKIGSNGIEIPDPEGRIKGKRASVEFDAGTKAFKIHCHAGGLPVWINRDRINPGETQTIEGRSRSYFFLPTISKVVLELTITE